MIKDNIKGLLLGIFIVVALLVCCMAIDSADENISVDQGVVNDTNTTVVGGVHYDDRIVKDNDSGIAKVHRVVHIKPHYPVVSMWARPSVRCNLPYKWYYRSFVDYCPHCKRYGVLYDAHKYEARFEHEWTCAKCGADYDSVVGKEKYSWSHYYLRRV